MASNIPLTASTRRRNQSRQAKKTNGWSAKWSDELKLRTGESAWVLLTPGKYPTLSGDSAPFLEVPMYKVQYINKWGNTSWGYFRGNEGSCTLRDRADCGDNRVSAPRRGEANRFFMNVIQFDLFRKVEVLDKTGQPMRYRGGKLKGEIVYRWEAVTSIKDKKDIIRNKDFSDCCFFRKKFVELPATQFDRIQGVARMAAGMCKCGGSLFPSVYYCSSCEEVLLDVNDSDLSEADVQRYGEASVRCNGCGNVDYPQACYICDSCDSPSSLHYSAVVAKISKVVEGQYPTIRVDKVVPLNEFEIANGELVVEVTEEGELALDDKGLPVFEETLAKLVSSQFDLESYTAAKENSYYSDILELKQGDVGYAAETQEYTRWR